MSKRTFNEFLQSLIDSGTDYWVDTITRDDALSILEAHNKLETIEKWHEELKQLCLDYLEHDCYIYMGLIQKFEELEEILRDSEFEVNGEKQ